MFRQEITIQKNVYISLFHQVSNVIRFWKTLLYMSLLTDVCVYTMAATATPARGAREGKGVCDSGGG